MFEDSIAAIPSIWSSMTSWLSPTVLFVLLNVMIGIIAFTSTLSNQTKHSIKRQEHSQNHPNQYHHHQQKQLLQQPNNLARSSSLLDRVKSINFYSYISQQSNPATAHVYDTTNSHLEHAQKLETSTHYIFEQPHQENHQESNLQPHVNDQYSFEHAQEEKSHDNGEQLGEEEVVFEEEDDDELQSMDEVYSKLTCSRFIRTNSDTKPSAGEAQPKLPTKMKKSASLKSPFGHFEAEDIVENQRLDIVKEMDHEVDAKADDFISKFKEQLKLQRRASITKYKEMIARGSGK